MITSLLKWLETPPAGGVWWATVLLTLLIEGITAFFRFGMKLESTRHTGFVAYLTWDIRIHHGYVGLLLLMVSLLRPEPAMWRNLTLIVGGSLVASDFIHHFLVLWPITGSPHFDLVYPGWYERHPKG